MPTPRVTLLICLIVAAALSRLLPHPENMTPITAMALFAAAYLPSRRLSLGLPLAAMLLGDIVLYATRDAEYQSVMLPMTACVYLAIIVIGSLGRLLQTKKSLARVAGTATLLDLVLSANKLRRLGRVFRGLSANAEWLARLLHRWLAVLPQRVDGRLGLYRLAVWRLHAAGASRATSASCERGMTSRRRHKSRLGLRPDPSPSSKSVGTESQPTSRE